MRKYIIYIRVSTKQQGASGLGLEAQREAVVNWIRSNPGTVLTTYEETESGKNNNRAKLWQAIEQCKQTGATLLIAKLDRLSRNASFIFTLRDTGINFVAVDLPELTTLTLGIFATIAQYEREIISKRTKDALQALDRIEKAKDPSFKLGKSENLTNPENRAKAKANADATRAKKEAENINIQRAKARIEELQRMEMSFAEIIEELEKGKYLTPAGGTKWRLPQVKRLCGIKGKPKLTEEAKAQKEAYRSQMTAVIKRLKAEGLNFADIARELEKGKYLTPSGLTKWNIPQVKRFTDK